MQSGGPVPPQWAEHVGSVLVGSAAIAARIAELGAQLSAAYAGKNPVLVVVLKGSVMFAADLSRALTVPHELEFIRARSYAGTQSTGRVDVHGLEAVQLGGRHVVVVEDIVDTGLTLKELFRRLEEGGAASVACCALLEKETARRREGVPSVDYFAFRIPDKFVVGYGLDLNQRFRHLPFVGVYKQ